MTEPNQEQIREFWKWYGWRYKPDELCGDPRSPHVKHSYGWQAPDDYKWRLLPPDIDLNNLFKYAVSQLDGYVMFTGIYGVHFIASKNGLNYESTSEREEDAIFQACWQVKEGER